MDQQDTGDTVALRRDGRVDDFEWVNAWALQSDQAPAMILAEDVAVPDNVHVLRATLAADAVRAATELATLEDAMTGDDDQLRRDLLAIERARDALFEAPSSEENMAPVGNHAVPLRRTADAVPVVLGSVLGVLMAVVFTAAAAFMKLAR